MDLKGSRVRMAAAVLHAIEPYFGQRRFTVCARRWMLLECFAGTPVRRMHSVGSARQLRLVLRRFAHQRLDGVSIHERLVDKASIASLREIADVIMTWPVNRPEHARALLGLGVDGLISDEVAALSVPEFWGRRPDRSGRDRWPSDRRRRARARSRLALPGGGAYAPARNPRLPRRSLAKRPRRGVPAAAAPGRLPGMRVCGRDGPKRVPPRARRRGREGRARAGADPGLGRANNRRVVDGAAPGGRRLRSLADPRALGYGCAARAAVGPRDRVFPAAAGFVALSILALGLFAHRSRGTLRRFLSSAARGLAILRSPSRYARTVLPFQLGAWVCRISVVWLVLEAFRIEAGLGTVLLIVVFNGLSTAVPVPGGAGSQQILATYALEGLISTAAAVSFSVGFQVGTTVLNTTVGLLATMLLFRTLRPRAAARLALARFAA